MNLILGDCLEKMNDIEDHSIDLILCDLPYGTTDRVGARKNNNRILDWDTIIPLDQLWEHYKRILSPRGCIVLTADQPFTSQLILSNVDWFRYEWIWVKSKVTGFLHANARPMKATEDILVFSPLGASGGSVKANTAMTYNPQGLVPKHVKKRNSAARLGNFLHKPEHMGAGNKLLHDTEYEQKFTNYPNELLHIPVERKNVHPTQKPVALMEYLIKTYSNENDIVLDNCMGSGTTGVACMHTNRRFIGIERDPQYFQIAEDRISQSINLFPTLNTENK